MEKYIVNSKMPGYTSVEITDDKLKQGNCLAVIILMDTTKEMLFDYYSTIRHIIINSGRVVLIGVGKDCNIFFPIATMMTQYCAYDIYMLDSLDILTSSYVERLLEREPSFEEVQSFIDGKITSYNDISTLIIGIEALVNENNIEGLKVFLEQHMPSIENMITTIEYLKKQDELSNSKELVTKLNKLKETVNDIEAKLKESKEKCSELRDSKFELNTQLEELKSEILNLKKRNSDLEDNSSTGTPVIKSYSEIRTSAINCKARLVIYFKEITYVPYMNSFVLALMELIKVRKNLNGTAMRVKLLIYDTATELFNSYSKMNTVNSVEFVNNRDNYVKLSEKFVITDPNPTILTEILQVTPEYDVVIVYDRMRKITDVVSGNNVYKFFVLNSSADYNNTKDILKISDTKSIITRQGSNIDTPFKLVTLPGFGGAGSSDSSRITKYNKMKTPDGTPIMKELFDRIRLNTIIKK